MPRIADFLLNCIIYLYPSLEAAQKSKNAGGSGFIVGIPSSVKSGYYYPYAVTNKHVIQEASSPIIRLNKRDGSLGYIIKEESDWTDHPNGDDIAVTFLGSAINGLNQKEHQVDFFIPEKMFAHKERIEEFDIGIGDDVYIIGRFQYKDGKMQNTPSARFGYISQMPLEPHINRYGDKLESYLVECHSINGFSGSPVFVFINEMNPRPKTDTLSAKSHTLLLGVDWGHNPILETVERYNELRNKWQTDLSLRVQSNSAMMSVAPVWKLIELLNMDKFKKFREEHERKLEKNKNEEPEEGRTIDDSMILTEDEFKKVLKKVSRKISPQKTK